MTIRSLNLRNSEKGVVHRGLSSPICSNAERSRIIANQTKDGHQKITAALFLPVSLGDEIDLRFLEIRKVSYKKDGEPNALLMDKDCLFFGWWCHISRVKGHHFGLIGRPNRRMKLGPHYQTPFPNIISTRKWMTAFNKLDDVAQAFLPELRELQYPRLAASFDNSRSRLDPIYLSSI